MSAIKGYKQRMVAGNSHYPQVHVRAIKLTPHNLKEAAEWGSAPNGDFNKTVEKLQRELGSYLVKWRGAFYFIFPAQFENAFEEDK